MSNDGGYHQHPFTYCINLVCCAGLIALIVFGSLCLTTGEYCGPAGYNGGLAMVIVGGVFVGVQILAFVCICCCSAIALSIIGLTD